MATALTETYPDLRGGYVVCPSGLVLPEAQARARYAPRAPVAIDLFCGCGGASLGIMKAGFRIVAALDNDPIAVGIASETFLFVRQSPPRYDAPIPVVAFAGSCVSLIVPGMRSHQAITSIGRGRFPHRKRLRVTPACCAGR